MMIRSMNTQSPNHFRQNNLLTPGADSIDGTVITISPRKYSKLSIQASDADFNNLPNKGLGVSIDKKWMSKRHA